MVKINKRSDPAEGSRNYRHGSRFDRLWEDFFGKCYLCEQDLGSSNIEHMIPHKGNDDLKTKWENLFLACVHCNSIKGTEFGDILNCTEIDPEDIIEFSFDCNDFRGLPVFKLKDENEEHAIKGKQTVELLNKIFCEPNTDQRIKAAEKLCTDLLEEMLNFTELRIKYGRAKNDRFRENHLKSFEETLDRSAPFAAFKRSEVRKAVVDDKGLIEKLKQFIAEDEK